MSNRERSFTHPPGLALGLAASLLLAAAAPAVAAESCCAKGKAAAADAQSTAPKSHDKETTKPAGTAGLTVFLDEQGRPTASPPGKAAEAAAIPASFSTSAAGLRQVQSAGPAGGVKVDLDGRFRTATTATTGPDGRIQVNCVMGEE